MLTNSGFSNPVRNLQIGFREKPYKVLIRGIWVATMRQCQLPTKTALVREKSPKARGKNQRPQGCTKLSLLMTISKAILHAKAPRTRPILLSLLQPSTVETASVGVSQAADESNRPLTVRLTPATPQPSRPSHVLTAAEQHGIAVP
eukprot:978637-Amphidinium_carterae.4